MSIVIFIDVLEITEPSSPSLSNSFIHSFLYSYLINRYISKHEFIPTMCNILDKSLMGERKRTFYQATENWVEM